MEQIGRIVDASIPEPNTGCWLWLGSIQKTGHGRLKWRGRTTGAHRLSWILHRGPIPDGLLVCHRCDTPSCVNPDHLFLGTHADNHADRNRKNRQAKGSANGRAKLDSTRVQAIKNDHRSLAAIAEEYGIGESQVSRIRRGLNWQCLFDGTIVHARR